MRTIILGLGNISFTDDGVGILIARALKNRIRQTDVSVAEASISGLDILDNIAGYEKAIILDAIQPTSGNPGSVYRLSLDQFSSSKEFSPHDINILTAIELGKKLDMSLPNDIIIFAIEAKDITTASEECTTLVKNAIPICAEMVLQELKTEEVREQHRFEKNEIHGGQYAK